jgi:hypothetical protein
LLEESAGLAEKVGWRWWRAGTLGALADVAIGEGRDGDARTLLRESIALARQHFDPVGLSWYLGQFALTLAREGRREEAGRVWGAVEAAAAFVPGGPWPRDAAGLERELHALADSDFERGRDEGQALTLDEVAAELTSID